MNISIEAAIKAPLLTVWKAWVTPDDIVKWHYAIDTWHCPRAKVNLAVNGAFSYRMEARDGSMGFDYEGVFTRIVPEKFIEYTLSDGRAVSVDFLDLGNTVKVLQTFALEANTPTEQQRQGWQNILNNFKQYVENKNKFADA